jgi:predicted RNase H-like nuclease
VSDCLWPPLGRHAAVSSTHPPVAGVDGCRGGWLVVTAEPPLGGAITGVRLAPRIVEVIEALRAGKLSAVAIDMPIALPDAGARAADVEARRRLGRKGASVFPTPARGLLGAASHGDAVRLGRSIDGRGISVQAFNLLPRIAELAAAVDASLNDVLVEAHPESAFAAMSGAPLASSKRTATGRAERIALLAERLGACAALDVRLPGAGADDVLDATANAWTAQRWLAGEAVVLGDGSVDALGLPMRIVT